MVLAVVAAAVVASVSVDPGSVAARLDEAFAHRGEEGGLEKLEAATRDALKSAPDDYEVLWRAARSMFWAADSNPTQDSKRKYGKEGWDLAERAIGLNGDRPEAYYYAAINIGAYGEGVGIWKALTGGLESKFLDRIDKAIHIDASTQMSGPLLAKARYYHQMPWPKRDLGRAEKLYKQAVENNPENLRAWYYLAQTQLKAGNAKDANDSMKQVWQRGVSYDPAEGNRIKSWGKRTQDAINEELND
ncbi:MAG: tetratricopeptide repeat protein [Myxococcaceae bacterium]